MDRGIVIIAMGNQLYGKLAFNLAVSIKFISPDIPIAVIHANNSIGHLESHEQDFFDHKIECPEEYYTDNGRIDYLKVKLFLNKLSPFDRTIYLDADTIFSPYQKMDKLFSDLDGLSFTIANRGETIGGSGHSDWVSLAEVKDFYGYSTWYDISSEFMYFEKNKSDQLFNDALSFYNDNVLNIRSFAGGKPDEPFLCLALLKNEMRPHKVPYAPSYWEYAQSDKNKWMKPEMIWRQFYLLSLGGNRVSDRVRDIYDNIVNYYSYKKGVKAYTYHKGTLQHKAKTIKERSLI